MIKFLQAGAGYFLLVGLVCNCVYIHSLQQDLMGLRGTIVDMDKIRSQYAYNLDLQYQRGCRQGIDYPPEYRKINPAEFNIHSPMIWCGEQSAAQEGEINTILLELGK